MKKKDWFRRHVYAMNLSLNAVLNRVCIIKGVYTGDEI